LDFLEPFVSRELVVKRQVVELRRAAIGVTVSKLAQRREHAVAEGGRFPPDGGGFLEAFGLARNRRGQAISLNENRLDEPRLAAENLARPWGLLVSVAGAQALHLGDRRVIDRDDFAETKAHVHNPREPQLTRLARISPLPTRSARRRSAVPESSPRQLAA